MCMQVFKVVVCDRLDMYNRLTVKSCNTLNKRLYGITQPNNMLWSRALLQRAT